MRNKILFKTFWPAIIFTGSAFLICAIGYIIALALDWRVVVIWQCVGFLSNRIDKYLKVIERLK